MLQQKFYWGTVRKSIIAFGNLFNNIQVDRRDESGEIIQSMKVPLSYAPKQKFLARIDQQPNDPEQDFQVVLPRMAFEMLGVTYDPSRRISLIQQTRAVSAASNSLNAQYAPTPYNIDVNLYIYTKNQDDGLQIVEQILPYFNPDYNLTLNAVPELDIKNDLPILLNSISYEDDYEGDFRNRRAIIWTLSFVMKLNFFGPINKTGFIKSAIATTYTDPELIQPQQRYNASLDPNTALPQTDYNILETFEDF